MFSSGFPAKILLEFHAGKSPGIRGRNFQAISIGIPSGIAPDMSAEFFSGITPGLFFLGILLEIFRRLQ